MHIKRWGHDRTVSFKTFKFRYSIKFTTAAATPLKVKQYRVDYNWNHWVRHISCCCALLTNPNQLCHTKTSLGLSPVIYHESHSANHDFYPSITRQHQRCAMGAGMHAGSKGRDDTATEEDRGNTQTGGRNDDKIIKKGQLWQKKIITRQGGQREKKPADSHVGLRIKNPCAFPSHCGFWAKIPLCFFSNLSIFYFSV